MEKPMMVAREDFSQEIAKVINGSGLHPVIVQPIIERVNEELKYVIQQQYQQEKQKYEEAVKAEQEKQAEAE